MAHKSIYKPGQMLRNHLKNERKKLRKLWKLLETEESDSKRVAIAQQIKSLHSKIELLEKDVEAFQRKEQAREIKKEETHKISGLANIRAREISGGLPSLGKKR